MNLTRFSNSSDTRSRAAALQAVFTGATTPAIGWIDATSAVPDDVLKAMCDRLEEPGVAAVTLSGCGRTLTSLGVPTSTGALRSASSLTETVRRVLYAPAGLAVFHRHRVLSVGGVDPTLVYGHEDANLGWRLALRGFRTVEIASGIDVVRFSSSREIAVADAISEATRLRHETASQLATLFVCAGDAWLRSALPAALARVLCLAAADAGLRPDQFDFGTAIPPTFTLPVRRMGQPEEVAEAVVWLASGAASFVVGHVLCTDGGFMAL